QQSLKRVYRKYGTVKLLMYLLVVSVTFTIYRKIGIYTGCKGVNNVAFIKTHKCASSSVQNILFRYGYTRKLNFAIGSKDVYLGHPEPFNRSMVPSLGMYGQRYHMLAHHSRYSVREEYASVINSNVFLFTIVREPMAIFESLAAHLKFKDIHIDDFANTTRKGHFTSYLSGKRTEYGRIGVNQMAFDLGLTQGDLNDSRQIVHFIRRIDAAMNFVLVAERMDESLILLKNALCWNLSDVIGFQQNVRVPQSLPSRIPHVVQKAILTVNFVDVALYSFFRSKLDDAIAAYGVERMQNDVAELRRRRMELYGDCVETEEPADKVFPAEFVYRKDVVGYRLKNGTARDHGLCRLLLANELQFTSMIRQRQMVDISAFYFVSWNTGGASAPSAWAGRGGLGVVALLVCLVWETGGQSWVRTAGFVVFSLTCSFF
ncbi:unnamed protein product, partial [Ixodes persulcatus]